MACIFAEKTIDAESWVIHKNEDAEYKIYLASGIFNPAQVATYNRIKDKLKRLEHEDCRYDIFLPLEDGYMLDSFQENPPELLHEVFRIDVVGMDKSNIIVASTEPDTGTQWEIGYALAKGKFIILWGNLNDIRKNFGEALLEHSNVCVVESEADLQYTIEHVFKFSYASPAYADHKRDLTYVMCSDANPETMLCNIDIFISRMGYDVEYVLRPRLHNDLFGMLRSARNVCVCVDDRPWLAGVICGYCNGIGTDVSTYSNFNYAINLMLIESVKTHAIGADATRNLIKTSCGPMGQAGLKVNYQDMKTY